MAAQKTKKVNLVVWDYTETTELDIKDPVKGAQSIPDGPPCAGCEHWAPERTLTVDSDGDVYLQGFKACWNTDGQGNTAMYDDFSCFSPREV